MEYAEYKPVEQGIDFSALTDKLATKVDDIGKDRAARKEELDTLASDTSRKFSEMEMTKTESLNDKLLALGDEGREKVNNWNTELKAGRLSPSEYKKRMAGLSEYVGLVGSTAKTFDERIQTHLKRQETGEAGVVEAEIANRLGMLADLSKTDYRVLDDGSIAIDVKDPATGEVYRTEDLGRINKTENIVSNKIDLPKNVNSTVKLWGKDGVYELLGMRGYTTSASASNDKDYLLAEQRLIDSVMTQGDASVLLDNGGVTYPSFAYSDGEYKKKLEEAKLDVQRRNKKIGVSEELSQEDLDQIEMSIIKMDANGKPLLTDKQKEKAEELIRSEIRLQVDNELKLVAPQVNIGGNTSSSYNIGQKRLANAEGYKLTLDVMNAKVGDTAETNTNLQLLMDKSRINGNPMKFEKVKVGNEYYIQGTPISKDEMGNPVYGNPIPFKTAQSLAPYVFGGNTSEIGSAYSAKIQGEWNKNKSKPKASANSKPKYVGLDENNMPIYE
jgi:hypothetical protein